MLVAVAVSALVLTGACGSLQNGKQITSVRHARAFERIDIKAACNVEFVQADSFAVSVTGEEAAVNNIVTVFSDNTLRIGMKNNGLNVDLSRRKALPMVRVSSPDLIGINMEGAGKFRVQQPLDTDTLTVYLKGMGEVDLGQVICDEFHSTLLGMGNVEVAGLTARHSTLRLRGVGDVDVKFVDGGTANCMLEGVGKINLSGTLGRLQQTLRGTGDIDTSDLRLTQSGSR